MLSQQQVDFYEEKGYLSVPDVISSEEITELRRVTDSLVEQARSVSESIGVFGLEPGHTAEHPQVRRIKRPSLHHEIYKSMLHHDTILEMVAQLIATIFGSPARSST